LNPTAISGNCGRLKCCLNFEFEFYKECSREVPRVGATVRCPDGEGSVVERQILAKRVKVRLDDGRVFAYDARKVREK
jgi:cell fate regulator YaaT (PSP1 superfamily)